jgi:hypothetical protein
VSDDAHRCLLELRLRESRGHGLDPALVAEFDEQLRRLADAGERRCETVKEPA